LNPADIQNILTAGENLHIEFKEAHDRLSGSFFDTVCAFLNTDGGTMYADYPISRELLHWESQSNTSQHSPTGQNLLDHARRGYTILLFARDQKKLNDCTVPFSYLGPADRVSYESERPIKMVWRLRHPMPVVMFEENRRGG
jgi:hypothetical protein